METVRHKIMDGRVQLYMRPRSPHWWSSCSVGGKQLRESTHEVSLSRAKDVARDWYLTLLGKVVSAALQKPHKTDLGVLRSAGQYLVGEVASIGKKLRGERKSGVTFKQAADQFLKEITILAEGERNPKYVYFKKLNLNVHLLPFFGPKLVTEITPGVIQDYRVYRTTSRSDKDGVAQKPARNTIHQEIVTLRQVLKTANRHGWLSMLPDLSTPFKANSKVGHRAWFSPEEWKQFYELTREWTKNPPRPRFAKEYEDFHDICLIMVNTGLRTDEARLVEMRDITVVTDDATGEEILEIAVRGKRGTGWCKSMPGAVFPFKRLVERNNPQPKDKVFAKRLRELMNAALDKLDMKHDREGNVRSAYSFRHTYISMRLSEGADIYQIAKNCRTSVEMIEKHYAIHIKNVIDTAAVNVRREQPKPKPAVEKEVKAKAKKSGVVKRIVRT